MDINITSNVKSLQRGLSKIEKKQIPFAIAKTLQSLAFEGMTESKRQAKRVLDRPTPYTLKGFMYKPKKAKKKNLESMVYIADAANSRKYMKYAIEGGVASKPGKSLPHPTANTRLNKYGNINRNLVKKAISGSEYVTSKKTGKRYKKYFIGTPKGSSGDDSSGIWERYGRNNKIKMVVKWRKSRKYQAKLPFYDITRKIVARRTSAIFNEEFTKAMRTAR